MKRDKNLYPLSHQHHNGLMAAMLLKKGTDKNADVKIMSEFILDVWENELRAHFITEEIQLNPEVLGLPGLTELFNQMKDEHHQIRKMIDEIRESNATLETIQSFHTLLETHIRFEERILFPYIEENSSEKVLTSLGEHLSGLTNRNCSNYPVKFWE